MQDNGKGNLTYTRFIHLNSSVTTMDKRYWIGLLKGVLELAFMVLILWFIEGMPNKHDFFNHLPIMLSVCAILQLNIYKEQNL
jgi:hypothetical protein